MNDKYEAELQHLLQLSGGNWEKLARVLFELHPNVIKEHVADRKEMNLAFNPRKKNLIRGKTLHDIWTMMDRLEKVMFGSTGHPRYSNRKEALQIGLGLRGNKLEDWEKTLATYNSLQKRIKLPICRDLAEVLAKTCQEKSEYN